MQVSASAHDSSLDLNVAAFGHARSNSGFTRFVQYSSRRSPALERVDGNPVSSLSDSRGTKAAQNGSCVCEGECFGELKQCDGQQARVLLAVLP